MPHVVLFIFKSVFQLPIIGLVRSWTLITKGGLGGIVGGVVGIMPYVAGFAFAISAYASLIQQGTIIPGDDAGLSKPGGLSACLSWVLVAVIVVVVEYIGYGIQDIFKGTVEIAEMKWD